MLKWFKRIVIGILLMTLTVGITASDFAVIKGIVNDTVSDEAQLFINEKGLSGNKVSFFSDEHGYIFREDKTKDTFHNKSGEQMYLDRIVLGSEDDFIAYFSDEEELIFVFDGSISWLSAEDRKDSLEDKSVQKRSGDWLAVIDNLATEVDFVLSNGKIEQGIEFNELEVIKRIDKSG